MRTPARSSAPALNTARVPRAGHVTSSWARHLPLIQPRHKPREHIPWSVNSKHTERVSLRASVGETLTNKDPRLPTLRLTFSSAETSAILGSGDGARFFTSNKTSRKHTSVQLVTVQAHRTAGRPKDRKQGFPRCLLRRWLHKPTALGLHVCSPWLTQARAWQEPAVGHRR